MSIVNFISLNQASHKDTQLKPSDVQILWQRRQESINDNMPKFADVPMESIGGVKYIFDFQNCNSEIDGEITPTIQRKYDCWLLSGVNALSSTKKGSEIIKKAIKKNSNNSVTVYLKGANYTINIPQSTFAAAKFSNSYVKGDDDMLAIEIAVEFYKRELLLNDRNNKQHGPNVVNGKTVMGKIKDPLSGGYPSDIMYLLAGKCSRTYYNLDSVTSKEINRAVEKKQRSPEKYSVTCNFKTRQNGVYVHHAYAVKRIEQDSVILINPHNAAKEERIPLEDFLKNVQTLTLLEL